MHSHFMDNAINSIQCKWYQYSIMYPGAHRTCVNAQSFQTRAQHLFAAQLLLDFRLEVLRLLGACPPALDLSVTADEELLKVPLYALEAHEAGLLILKPFECGVCLCAIDLLVEGRISQCSVIVWGIVRIYIKTMWCERVLLVLTSIFPRTGKLTP